MKKSLFALMFAAMGATSAMAQDVKYFADYTTIYGLARGRIEISPEAMKHRSSTYKFMYKDGRLDSLVEIKGNGKLADYYEAYKYYYGSNGKIDYIMKSTENDYVMLDYSDDLTVVTYRNPGDKNSVRLASLPDIFVGDMGEYAYMFVCAKEKYTYDSKGRIIKVESLDATDNPTMYYDPRVPVMEFEYDDENKVLEGRYVNYDGSAFPDLINVTTFKYKYNDAGYTVEKSNYGEDGKLLNTYTCSYDEYGSPVSTLTKEDKKFAKSVDKYAKKSEKAEKNVVFERNSLGCITKYVLYEKGKPKEEWHGKYDERGLLTVAENILKTKNILGEVVSKIEYEYNDKACAPSKVTYYDEKGNVARTELLKYDSRHQRTLED